MNTNPVWLTTEDGGLVIQPSMSSPAKTILRSFEEVLEYVRGLEREEARRLALIASGPIHRSPAKPGGLQIDISDLF